MSCSTRDRAGVFRGPVRRVLRRPAREHGASTSSPSRVRSSTLAGAGGSAGAAAGDCRPGARPAGAARLGLRVLPPIAGHERNRDRSGPTSRISPPGCRFAAATIPNSRGYLAGWILDPQHIKPGNKMPATDLTRPRAAGPARLSGEPALMAIANVERLQRAWAEPAGRSSTRLATVDHKRIGIRYLRHRARLLPRWPASRH